MKPEPEPTSRWVRLKRHEGPGEGYFDDFLTEFHRRQRAALLKQSSVSLFLERFKTYFEDAGGGPKWAYAPVLAIFSLAVYAVVAAASEPEMTPMPFADTGWGEVSLVSSVGRPVAEAQQEPVEEGERTVFDPDASFENIQLIEFR